jgi:hypothetical protein
MTKTTDVLTERADFDEPVFDRDMILDWAMNGQGGDLIGPAASAFASWLDADWNDYDDGTGTQTNEDVLRGALNQWVGGHRVFPDAKLKAAAQRAVTAHRALYDQGPAGERWREGPHPIAAAELVTALAEAGILEQLTGTDTW